MGLDELLTIRAIADRLHKSEQSINRLIKCGKLPYFEISPHRRLISESDFAEFLNTKRVCPPPKRFDNSTVDIGCSPISSLKTEYVQAEVDVKSLRKEISQLCRSN